MNYRDRIKTIKESCRCINVIGTNLNRIGMDKPEDDHVRKYAEWRRECPDHDNRSHAAFCERCDNSYPHTIGGADILKQDGWQIRNPFEKFPEPLSNRASLSDKITPEMLKEDKQSRSNLFACGTIKSKIEELSVQEGTEMSEYIRDILRMANGGIVSGRSNIDIPDELMDALAGDAAQEALVKERVLEEMRNREEGSDYGGGYVDLDTMTESMSQGDVDGFLKHARKKIIKRSKVSRKSCCLKIGGVLDQLLGPAAGKWTKVKAPSDRGEEDPIGEEALDEALSDDHKKLYTFRKGESREARGARIAHHKKTGKHVDESDGVMTKLAVWMKENLDQDVDVNSLNFIAEEFKLAEHSDDCPLRAVLAETISEEDKWIQGALKRPGALRSYFNVKRGEEIPLGEARAKYAELQDKAEGESKLSESDQKLFKRLNLFLKVLKPANEWNDLSETTVAQGEEDEDPIKRRALLAMKADAAQRAAEESLKKSRLFGRDMDGQRNVRLRNKKDLPRETDLGEWTDMNDDISETAEALAGFMEAAHTGSVGNIHLDDHGKGYKTRSDNADYPTELRALAKGRSYDSGKPKLRKAVDTHAKHRYDKDADPIGEGDFDGSQISETASALSAFMEASHTGSAGNLSPKTYWQGAAERGDNKTDYVKTGQEKAKGEFPFSKHRYDGNVTDDDLPGRATKDQLVRP